ncbi:MAG TPA: cysteine--tRNA ligase [bacterium]|nr:cysteine--tRNA ligase [bacterium]
MNIHGNILDLIGNTPLLKINRLAPRPPVEIYVKLESCNPGGSIKDRVALAMIEAAERSGELTHDKTIIEATSGNTGIGLAIVARVKGYRLTLAMSEAASEERRKILKAYGAEILLTPARMGTDGAIEEVYRLVRENPAKYYNPDQFNNPASIEAHYQGTGREIWEQTEGRVTHVVAALGTTGTIMGITKRLKELNPAIRTIGMEPYLGHKIQGLKNMKESYRPGIFDKHLLDRIIHIEDEEAFATARALAREESLFVGMSSGAAMAAARRIAAELNEGLIVAILPDGGERYLSTKLFVERTESAFRFYNTLTRRKESFEPAEPGVVKMYTCGPTVDGPPHLGNCRRFVVADLVRRYLEHKGLEVRHVVNITDLDDRTIRGAELAGQPLAEFTRLHTEKFLQDMKCLGVTPATYYPKASEHVMEMSELTEKLISKGFAYEKLRSVYFDISRFRNYGKLSGMDLGQIQPGMKTDLENYEKDNPRDFTLLKRTTLAELKKGIFFQTRWGNVRPGWHIECAAMSMKYLGESFDIHTSDTDLIFPHHENEIAISEAATGKPFARYWLHNALVMVEGKKISGLADMPLVLQDLLDLGYSGREVRYWLLAAHYRKSLNYSVAALETARIALRKIDNFTRSLAKTHPGSHAPEAEQSVYDLRHRFEAAMDDDLNTPAALATLFDFIRSMNRLIDKGQLDQSGIDRTLQALDEINRVLNIMVIGAEEKEDEEIQQLIEERETARRAQDWSTADRIRSQLFEKGVIVRDSPAGPRTHHTAS